MANLLYVDNSNIWIEGLHVAAFKCSAWSGSWPETDRATSVPLG